MFAKVIDRYIKSCTMNVKIRLSALYKNFNTRQTFKPNCFNEKVMISRRNWRLPHAGLKLNENRANLMTLTFQRAETEKTFARQFRKKITTRHFSRRRRPGKNLFVFCRREPFKPLSLCSNYSKWRLLRKSSDGRTVGESFRKHSFSIPIPFLCLFCQYRSRSLFGFLYHFFLDVFLRQNRSVKKLFNWIRASRSTNALSLQNYLRT